MSEPVLLLIDDDPVARQTLTALLVGAGYRIEEAGSGREGLRKASLLHPEVILLDIMMPGMDGYEVCRRLRNDPELAEVPIIMITALDDRESRLRGLEAGADDFLSKPFDSLELETRLRSLQRVARYRHLLEERARLAEMYRQIEAQNAELRRLSEEVLMAQENERRRVAIELHDEIGQLLTGLKLLLDQQHDAALPALQAVCAQARQTTLDLLRRVRDLSLDLRPTLLDDFGLLTALDWLFKRFEQQASLKISHNLNPLDERRFPRPVETAAFRIVQEALTNIARHAGVGEATVTLTVESDRLEIAILDAGAGFDPEQIAAGRSTGLSAMRERARLAGGTLQLQSAPGEGTLITAVFPLGGGEQP
ncbi:MAG: response regulator [Anaerolineales bacterium]